MAEVSGELLTDGCLSLCHSLDNSLCKPARRVRSSLGPLQSQLALLQLASPRRQEQATQVWLFFSFSLRWSLTLLLGLLWSSYVTQVGFQLVVILLPREYRCSEGIYVIGGLSSGLLMTFMITLQTRVHPQAHTYRRIAWAPQSTETDTLIEIMYCRGPIAHVVPNSIQKNVNSAT